jgi:hypothetical protein
MTDRKEYAAPELTLIGEASEVVRGLGSLGVDIRGELLVSDFEFESDQPSTDSRTSSL